MKKAVVVGGSNGIGAAICKKLIDDNYFVHILDIVQPTCLSCDTNDKYEYDYCNLNFLDENLIKELAKDSDVELLMVTSGYGKVSKFEYIHPAEIQNMFQVNAVSVIKIISYFYDRINSKNNFYCGVMGSIAGLVSSPLFSVYSATKSALCRFIESVNIELEISGTKNRILNVSPSSVKGTKFNGGDNNLSLVSDLADEIVKNLFASETLFIPKYEELLKNVIKNYQDDPHAYGIHSYNYKMNSSRVTDKSNVVIGYLSGTFDLFHVGHLNLLRRAKNECDYLIVGVHPDASHKNKQVIIPLEDRIKVVEGCKYVDKVVPACREDCDAWDLYHYNRLFVGSDYKGTERFERYEKIFKEKDVKIVYFPYTSSVSSTKLRAKINENK